MYKKSKTAAAIIVAAGNSSRMGNNKNKQFLLVDKVPVLVHTLKSFEEAKSIDSIYIVTREDNITNVEALVKKFKIRKVKKVIKGGQTRQQSVMCGLKEINDNTMVAVHDGARPFVSPALINKTIEAAYQFGAAAPGVIPKDTVKVSDENSFVYSTPKRDILRLIQTPQVFLKDEIQQAYLNAEKAGFSPTDDCSVIENSGKNVYIVDGEYTNIKVTTPEDLPIAEAICKFLQD